MVLLLIDPYYETLPRLFPLVTARKTMDQSVKVYLLPGINSFLL